MWNHFLLPHPPTDPSPVFARSVPECPVGLTGWSRRPSAIFPALKIAPKIFPEFSNCIQNIPEFQIAPKILLSLQIAFKIFQSLQVACKIFLGLQIVPKIFPESSNYTQNISWVFKLHTKYFQSLQIAPKYTKPKIEAGEPAELWIAVDQKANWLGVDLAKCHNAARSEVDYTNEWRFQKLQWDESRFPKSYTNESRLCLPLLS